MTTAIAHCRQLDCAGEIVCCAGVVGRMRVRARNFSATTAGSTPIILAACPTNHGTRATGWLLQFLRTFVVKACDERHPAATSAPRVRRTHRLRYRSSTVRASGGAIPASAQMSAGDSPNLALIPSGRGNGGTQADESGYAARWFLMCSTILSRGSAERHYLPKLEQIGFATLFRHRLAPKPVTPISDAVLRPDGLTAAAATS